jgi:molecular chaperone HtpG
VVTTSSGHNPFILVSETPFTAALPGIDRSEVETDAKLLILGDDDPPIRNYRCFIAIADRVREERGDFFSTSAPNFDRLGGQRVLFIFQHFSGEYGLYYDLQSSRIVAESSGGGVFDTCTIVMKNRVFIPVPEAVQAAFIPQNEERKRFDVRCDLLSTGEV